VKYYTLIIWLVFGFGVTVWAFVKAKVRTTTIDRNVGIVAVHSLGILGSRYKTYRFAEVAKSFGGLRINTDFRRRTWLTNSPLEYKVYGIQLPLASGDEVDLSGYASFQLNGCKVAVEKALEEAKATGISVTSLLPKLKGTSVKSRAAGVVK